MEARVGVLRATGETTPPELSEAVDAALLRDLAELAGITDPLVSPVDLAEIQLNVGCTDDGRACLEAMAHAAGVSALLVRSLDVTGEAGAWLELRYFDSASTDAPTAVRTQVPAASSGELVQAVPALVRELFGIPEIAAPAEPVAAEPQAVQGLPARQPADQEASSIAPWILVGAGAAALTTGLVVGLVARDDFEAWKSRPIRTEAEAQRARSDFDDLETRAIVADVAMASGVIAAGIGLTLLLFDGADERANARERGGLKVQPRLDGAVLIMHGTFHEGS